MFGEIVVRFAAPTLAGLKSGNLFSYAGSDVIESVKEFNKECFHKDIRAYILKREAGRSLIYICRPQKLKKDFEDKDVKSLLQKCGYDPEDFKSCIRTLIKNLKRQNNFPHEIGLFLGYPPEDVSGFIEGKACGAKAVGAWKVYGDVDKAKKMFNIFDRCTKKFLKDYKNNHSLYKLVA